MINSPFEIPYYEICGFDKTKLYRDRNPFDPSVDELMNTTIEYKKAILKLMDDQHIMPQTFDVCIYQLINLNYIHDKYAVIDLRHQILDSIRNYLIDRHLRSHKLNNVGLYRIKKQIQPAFKHFQNHQNKKVQAIANHLFEVCTKPKQNPLKNLFNTLSALSMQPLADLYAELHEASFAEIDEEVSSFIALQQGEKDGVIDVDFKLSKQEYRRGKSLQLVQFIIESQTKIERQLDAAFQKQKNEFKTKAVITKDLNYYRFSNEFPIHQMPPIG